MSPVSLAPSRFFSDKELRDIVHCMKEMEGIGITVQTFYKEMEGDDKQKKYFMGLARLWRVVRNIIEIAFIEKLKDGKLTLIDRQGDEWGVKLVKANSERGGAWLGIYPEEEV